MDTSVTAAQVIAPAEHLARVAVQVARLGAEFVRQSHGEAVAAGTKSTPTDVVTETDLAAETLIRDELESRCPGSSIVGEEYDDTVGVNSVRWIVDPIDGTVNFLYGLPVVSVSIAAEVNGQVVAGAVADVLGGHVFSAVLDRGAVRDGVALAVNRPAVLAEALIGTGFAYDSATRAEQADVLTRLLPACRDIRCMGSAALNLCWVGAGLIDGYFERNIKLHDYAAGALVATQAGAVVRLPDHGIDGMTVAASPTIASELDDLIGR